MPYQRCRNNYKAGALHLHRFSRTTHKLHEANQRGDSYMYELWLQLWHYHGGAWRTEPRFAYDRLGLPVTRDGKPVSKEEQ